MEQYAQELEQVLYQHQMAGVKDSFPEGSFVLPHYDGLCLSNVVPTAARILGASVPGWRPLDRSLWHDLSEGVRRVVVVVIDAVGYYQFLRWLDDEPDNVFARLVDHGRLFPITSVFPSTTTAALASLWTGRPPAAHGLMGYELFLQEWGSVVNMIRLSPPCAERRGVLTEWGLDPQSFLQAPVASQVLAPFAVTSRFIIRSALLGSALSQMLYQGADDVGGHITGSDLWVNLRHLLCAHRSERLLLTAYWGGADAIGHVYGPASEQSAAEIRNLAYSFENEFLRPLAPEDREGTLLIVTADHGQIRVPREHTIHLRQHPSLAQDLVMQPCGDPRAAYLYVRARRLPAVQSYLATELGHAFVALPSDQALLGGLFGPGRPAPAAAERLGDLLLLGREDYILYAHDKEPSLKGRHGGLHPDEMLIPLLLARLDDVPFP
jgi:hypothetical protein